MMRLWRAGMGPNGSERRRRESLRRRWRVRAAITYKEMAEMRKDQVAPYNWVGVQRKETMEGCCISQYFMLSIMITIYHTNYVFVCELSIVKFLQCKPCGRIFLGGNMN